MSAFLLDHWVELLVIGLGVVMLALGLTVLSIICSAGLVFSAYWTIAWRRIGEACRPTQQS